jgi:hypothetical protein
VLTGQLGNSSLGQWSLGAIGSAQETYIPPFPPPPGRIFRVREFRKFVTEITPAEVIDYAFDWSGNGLLCLNPGEVIKTSLWTSNGLCITTFPPYIQSGGTATTVWLSLGSGVIGNFYLVTNTITTSGDRTLQKSFICGVRAQN